MWAVKLVKDETTKKSKGYAFIQYNSQDDALRALESMDHQVVLFAILALFLFFILGYLLLLRFRNLNRIFVQYFDGRVIFVELAKPRKHMYGGYPKTSGPPAKEENSLPQADKEDNSLDQDGSVE